MAEITKELGRIPVSRGNYQSTTEYYKDNIVQYKRGSYQVVSESPIIGIPPTNDKNVVNPGWTLFAGTLDAQDVVNQIKEQETKSIQAVANREAEILAKSDAAEVSFDNTGTSLSGTNVQGALEELAKYTINGNLISSFKFDPGNRIKELYIKGLSNDDDIKCTRFTVSSEKVSLSVKTSDDRTFNFIVTENISTDTVYESTNKEAWVVLQDLTEYSYSSDIGIFELYGNRVRNLSYNPIIEQYLLDTLNSFEFISNKSINNAIQEILILSDKKTLRIKAITITDNVLAVNIVDEDGNTVAFCSKKIVPQLGQVYYIPEYNNSGIYAFIVLKDYISISSDKVYEFTDAAYNIKNSPLISNYISKQSNSFISEFYAISSDETINSHFANLFVSTDRNNTISITYIWHTSENNLAIYLFKNDVGFARLLIDDTTASIIPGEVYSLETYDGSDDFAYIVFNNIDDSNISLKKVALNSSVIFDYSKNPIIEQYLLSKNANDFIKIRNWSSLESFNAHIDELYIPNFVSKYGEGCNIVQISATSKLIRFAIRDANDDLVCIVGKDVTPYYYSVGAISPIYDYSTKELIGWVKLRYLGEDFAKSSVRSINTELVEDINNSPNIAKMLNSKEQIVIMGDSILGYPEDNMMPDILRGIHGVRVWNMACGGCCMAWRQEGGDMYYDKFTFSSIIDSLIANDFSVQIEAIETKEESYRDFTIQVENMKKVDLSLPTTIICDYINNDITNNVPIGVLWEYTDTLENYNRMTFCGAQNYGVQKLISNYMQIKLAFITDSYRWRKQGGTGELVPPYLYENGNGDTAIAYCQAEKDNCKRLGLRCYDFQDYGVRNAFAMDYSTVDGTHCNAYGFQELSKYVNKIYNDFN